MNYQPVIGLEIHLQPKTKSKMFCSCSAEYFGKAPNTHTCPVCLGLPGALPVPNRKAIELCIKLALALNCEIASESKFDRKNYFYPDLPKGYQISQYDEPIGQKGYVEIDVNGDARRIRITRVHMEEDTGKSTHVGDETLLDYNKSGVPLIEIVTEPDFTSKAEVDAFSKRLRQIIRYCEISDADMEKGQMRYELNISVKNENQSKLPDYKVEVKNIGSISLLQKIIDFEVERQSELLKKGEKVVQETRGAKDMSGVTLSQRVKEGSADYRYFPEPDIPPMQFDRKLVEQIKITVPELPQDKKWRYVKDWGIEADTAETLVSYKSLFTYFEEMINKLKTDERQYAKDLSNWLIGDLRRLTKKHKQTVVQSKVKPEYLVELVKAVVTKQISNSIAKDVLTEVFNTGKSPNAIIKSKNIGVIQDSTKLREVIKKVIETNPKIVNDYKNKNENAIKFLVGQVMRETKGQADPILTKTMLEQLLQ